MSREISYAEKRLSDTTMSNTQVYTLACFMLNIRISKSAPGTAGPSVVARMEAPGIAHFRWHRGSSSRQLDWRGHSHTSIGRESL